MEPWSITDSLKMAATPEQVWDLIADVSRMGEWSPETTKVTWIRGADTPVVGAKFRGSNRQGWLRWSTTCEVTEAEHGRVFAFVRRGPDGGCDWRFTLQADDAGTMVTESMQHRREPPVLMQWAGRLLFGADREDQIRRGIRTTLEAIRATVERRQ